MATTFYLVRHGETVWNAERRFQGHHDIPLNEVGRRQARALGRRLRDLPFEAVWSSDLSRARETASLAVAGRQTVHEHAGLREMAFGRWEGLTRREIEARYPEEFAAVVADPFRRAPVGGESEAEVYERVVAALSELRPERCRSILIVSHGKTVKALLCALLGLDPSVRDRFVFANASLSVVEYEKGRGRLLLLNDTCHLDGER